MRKNLLGIVILAIVSTVVFSATFDLSGRWVASFERHKKDEGFLTGYDSPVSFVFEQQEGNSFTGYKEFINYSTGNKEKKESFSGVIDYSGEKLYCAEHEDGYLFGDIISENEIVMYYVEDKETAIAVYYTLQRESNIPNLVGEWHSETMTSYVKEKNSFGKGNTGTFVISEQQGHVFSGYKFLKTRYSDEHREDLSGVISKDGKKVYFAEHDDGYAFADIIDTNTIHLYYLEDGELKTMYQVLTKVE